MTTLPHRILAEKALGRPLDPKHPVHHHHDKSGKTTLVICENDAYHKLLHQRAERLRLGLDLDGPISKTFRFRASPTFFSRLTAVAKRNNRTASGQARFVLETFIEREEEKQRQAALNRKR